MQTIARILMEAGTLEPGFHLHIDNPPWMPLDIEDIGVPGPHGLVAISVAHYGQQNGDPMRDPEMLFEVRRQGNEIELFPYYWRNDYLGIEQYSSYRDDQQKLFTLAGLKQQHEQFARLWDKNLRAQGYYEAFAHRVSTKPLCAAAAGKPVHTGAGAPGPRRPVQAFTLHNLNRSIPHDDHS